MLDKKEVGEKIRYLRESKRLSQVDLGELVGVHGNTVSQWENGAFMPKTFTLQKIAQALHVTEAELLNGPKERKIEINLIFGDMPEKGEIDMSENGNSFDL